MAQQPGPVRRWFNAAIDVTVDRPTDHGQKDTYTDDQQQPGADCPQGPIGLTVITENVPGLKQPLTPCSCCRPPLALAKHEEALCAQNVRPCAPLARQHG